MSAPPESPGEFSSLPFLGIGHVLLRPLWEEHRLLLAELSEYDGLRLGATLAGLLTVPELQSNCLRLEILVHMALAHCNGSRKPNQKLVSRLFSGLGEGMAGRYEDPAEDVFVTSVRTPRGNFRVLEGIWESAGFNLQRVIDALERVPTGPRYDRIRDCAYALLRLSDKVCERAELTRYELGNAIPKARLSGKHLNALSSLRSLVRFSETDLTEAGIRLDELAEFGFDPNRRRVLMDEGLGHTSLERRPVVYLNGDVLLLLPTAVSAAIRRYIVEGMERLGLREPFALTLADEYAEFFSETSLLGSYSNAPLEFRRTACGLFAGAMIRSDAGLYISFVFFCDTLDSFSEEGLVGIYPDPKDNGFSDDLERWIDEAYNTARETEDFRECLTVLVACGIGRGGVHRTSDKQREHWRWEMVSAADMATLSELPGFKALSLWRLLDSQDRLQKLGVALHNINGLLNMVAWARSLGGHLIPHGDMPDDFVSDERASFVMIEQNAIRKVRHEASVHWDAHVALDPEAAWVKVRKPGESFFSEDQALPFYMAEETPTPQRWPRGVFETPSRSWWIELERTSNLSGTWAYERAKMLKTWLCRMAPVLDAAMPMLPTGPLLLRAKFEGPTGDRKEDGPREFLTLDAAKASIRIEADQGWAVVRLVASPSFEDAIFHPENIAEHALVDQAVRGFAALAGVTLDSREHERLVHLIVRDKSARQSHAFMARRFRDFVRASVPGAPMMIDVDDTALLKLGLGWRARDRALGGNIRGKDESTSYLNAMVRMLEDEVCSDLRKLDRHEVIAFSLGNHERAILDRDNWERTAGAILALHDDIQAARDTIAQHRFELNAVFQSSRLLIEFAICECPLTGGRKPGRLDISRLMSKMMMIAGLGGWSDAIRWDAMEPRVRITALGDIHGNVEFYEEVVAPYSRVGADLTIQDRINSYADNLREAEPVVVDGSELPQEFWEALEEELDAPFDTVRKFADALENIGIERRQAIFRMKRSELITAVLGEFRVPEAAVGALVENLAFRTRPEWRTVPEGYDDRDRFPWRFRRRLSILRKPLLLLEDKDDPELIIAPGIVRDTITYMVSLYHRGDYPLRQLKPKMRKWSGTSRDRIGHEFTVQVGKELEKLGWRTEIEIPITKLLRKGFDQDYGDVDVLAWRPETGRILIIECKYVQHRKSDGEIAEQLRDFRGEMRDGKPDVLLRHLNRIAVISAHVPEFARYINFNGTPTIESHLIFKNPVPMQFALNRMQQDLQIHTFAGLASI